MTYYQELYLMLLLGRRVRNHTSTPMQDMAMTNTNHHHKKMYIFSLKRLYGKTHCTVYLWRLSPSLLIYKVIWRSRSLEVKQSSENYWPRMVRSIFSVSDWWQIAGMFDINLLIWRYPLQSWILLELFCRELTLKSQRVTLGKNGEASHPSLLIKSEITWIPYKW